MKYLKLLINSCLDVLAFCIAVVLIVFYRAQRQAGKMRNYLNSK